jgi:hypothetical protein
LDSTGRILIDLKYPGSSESRTFATGTTLETVHVAGKHPDVMEVLNICVIIGRMDGRKILINFSGISYRLVVFEPMWWMVTKTWREFTLEKAKNRTGGAKFPVDRWTVGRQTLEAEVKKRFQTVRANIDRSKIFIVHTSVTQKYQKFGGGGIVEILFLWD